MHKAKSNERNLPSTAHYCLHYSTIAIDRRCWRDEKSLNFLLLLCFFLHPWLYTLSNFVQQPMTYIPMQGDIFIARRLNRIKPYCIDSFPDKSWFVTSLRLVWWWINENVFVEFPFSLSVFLCFSHRFSFGFTIWHFVTDLNTLSCIRLVIRDGWRESIMGKIVNKLMLRSDLVDGQLFFNSKQTRPQDNINVASLFGTFYRLDLHCLFVFLLKFLHQATERNLKFMQMMRLKVYYSQEWRRKSFSIQNYDTSSNIIIIGLNIKKYFVSPSCRLHGNFIFFQPSFYDFLINLF